MSIDIILASASPRRRELLKEIVPEFTLSVADIPEIAEDGETARTFALRLSGEKARKVSETLTSGIVIGADTVVTLDGRIFCKPEDTEDALRMLRELSGRTHSVITAFTIIDAEDGRAVKRAVESLVTFKAITDEDIRSYLEAGESMDKAGAYAVQGVGRRLIEGTEGSYTNIIGLPLEEVREVLLSFGVTVRDEGDFSPPAPGSLQGKCM